MTDDEVAREAARLRKADGLSFDLLRAYVRDDDDFTASLMLDVARGDDTVLALIGLCRFAEAALGQCLRVQGVDPTVEAKLVALLAIEGSQP